MIRVPRITSPSRVSEPDPNATISIARRRITSIDDWKEKIFRFAPPFAGDPRLMAAYHRPTKDAL
jgi:hypothetical protein